MAKIDDAVKEIQYDRLLNQMAYKVCEQASLQNRKEEGILEDVRTRIIDNMKAAHNSLLNKDK